jgi:hypothetical protein
MSETLMDDWPLDPSLPLPEHPIRPAIAAATAAPRTNLPYVICALPVNVRTRDVGIHGARASTVPVS